jgi:transposase
MLTMDQVAVVRHRVLVEGASRREVARALGISRNTVKRYLAGASIGERKPSPRSRPVLDSARPRIEALLAEAPRWTAGKQRLTATQLHRLLRAEGFSIGRTTVKDFVHEWRRKRAEVFVPLVYRPGDLGLIDFFEVFVDVAGKRIKAFLFVVRLMASGRDFAWLFPRQDQTCFLEGHVRAFEHLGGVPHRLGYDNLRAAVAKILAGSERQLAARFAALSNHYLFEACFARPGTGHDKGGVEARGKGIRLEHLVPIPSGDDLESISRVLLERLDRQAAEQRNRDGLSVLDRFAEERTHLLPLPAAAFDPAATKHVTATRRALVQVEGGVYSVWSIWAGLTLPVLVGVDAVRILGPDGRTVRHRKVGFGRRSIDYRHYLPELARKPQALRQVAEELVPALGDVYVRAWHHLADVHGPKQAARIFAQILRALEDLGGHVVARRVEEALARGEPLQLAVRPMPEPMALPEDSLPPAVRDISVEGARAADFDVLLRGAA